MAKGSFGVRQIRRTIIIIALLSVVVVGYGIIIGWGLSHPSRDPIESNPGLWGMPYQSIRFPSQFGHLRLHGWWIPAPHKSRLTVIFAHGYGANREESGVPGLAVAHAINLMGANVLMFDFRGEGNSPGNLVSVGVFEQRDLRGAIRWVQKIQAPTNKIVLLGYSMGASTAILAGAADPSVSGVIADSPYANLKSYLAQSLPVWTHLPRFPFDSIILGLLPLMTGVHLREANPLGVISHMGHRPILLIAGKADRTIPDVNSVQLYNRVKKSDPAAQLWLVPSATHVQAFKVSPVEYLKRVYQFLHRIDSSIAPPPVSVGF